MSLEEGSDSKIQKWFLGLSELLHTEVICKSNVQQISINPKQWLFNRRLGADIP